MKKAKIILASIALFAFVGGVLAFNAPKFTALQAFTTTTRISTVINGSTYYKVTSPALPVLCTTTDRWITNEGVLVNTLTSSATTLGTFTTLGTTITTSYPTCTTTQTFTTVVP
ncbi:hypothetical protein SAMN05428949_4706 [Chitinophaga sp. YR627]|uniref:hypothetical protein n=1 Tax=Chitinophaga sp. YR627 TaxID=1881041 RepID=UPI0008EE86BA|nr:hypothetical protein [Chitinophaga sp. YR627]SFO26347.1 hypothetical protein SAMN05428949_4706 [Chitinophaga sp. YR627]